MEKKKTRQIGFASYLKNLDLFGMQVKWLVDGQEKFKSYVGAVLTLLISSIIIAFGARKFQEMYTQSSPDIKSYPLKINLTDDKFKYTPSTSNFQIGFGLTDGRTLPASIASF